MNLIKKKFTLIELIIVIGILAILSSLVLPNIQGIEGEAKGVALATDRKAIQTAVDMYKVDNVGEPIIDGETINIGEPGTIDMDKLYPKYLRDFLNNNAAKYWLDYTGKVWVSLVDAPTGVTNDNGNLSWDAVEGAVGYIVYEFSEEEGKIKYNLKKLGQTKTTNYTGEALKTYLVQSVDQAGNRSALVGNGYTGYSLEEKTDENLSSSNTLEMIPDDQNIIFISSEGSDTGDGSQNNPYNDIQVAIDNALPGDALYIQGEIRLQKRLNINKSLNFYGDGALTSKILFNNQVSTDMYGTTIYYSSDNITVNWYRLGFGHFTNQIYTNYNQLNSVSHTFGTVAEDYTNLNINHYNCVFDSGRMVYDSIGANILMKNSIITNFNYAISGRLGNGKIILEDSIVTNSNYYNYSASTARIRLKSSLVGTGYTQLDENYNIISLDWTNKYIYYSPNYWDDATEKEEIGVYYGNWAWQK